MNEYYRSLTLVYDYEHQPITQAWTYYLKSEQVRQYGGLEVVSGNWSAESHFKLYSSI